MPEAEQTTEAAPPRARRKYTRKAKAPDVMQSPRKEVHSSDFQIGQHKTITDDMARDDVSREKFDPKMFGRRLTRKDDKEYGGTLLFLDKIEVTPEYLAELAFNEEPIKIIINPSTHKNAASIMENWSNGIRAEQWINNQWLQVGDLPVSKPITVKRKIVEHIVRARVMSVNTIHEEPPVASPRNELIRTSSNVHSFSILHDPNPRGAAWLEMIYARPI